MLGMSVCTIMKDEEENLPAFLEAVLKYGFEMVLVDTGSSDKSIEIATKHGCMVHRYVWKNDFSDARNFAASKAKNDIIIALDCDEIIKSINVDELNKITGGLKACYFAKITLIIYHMGKESFQKIYLPHYRNLSDPQNRVTLLFKN